MSRRQKAYLYLIATAALWGAAGPIIKYTLEGIDPIPFLTYRFVIAGLFSVVFFLVKIAKGKKFRQLRAHLPLALLYGFLAVPVTLGILFFALDNSTVLDLTLIGVAGPLLVTLGGTLFFRDHITHRERIGIGIVLAGVFFNSIVPIFSLGSEVRFTGNLLLILYLISDCGSVLVAKKAVRLKIKSSNLTNLAFIVGAIILVPIALITNGANETLSAIFSLPFKYHLGVWYMALLSGNLAYYFYVRGQRTIEVSEASLFNYIQPLFMIPLAVLWLKESLSKTFIIGAIIITIGLVIAELKKKRYNT